MILCVFHKGLETSPEDSCISCPLKDLRRLRPFPLCGDGPAQVSYKGKESIVQLSDECTAVNNP